MIIILLVGYFFLSSRKATSPTKDSDQEATQQSAITVDKTATGTADINSLVIKYTANGFQPNKLKVSTGSIITFVNESNSPMWVASNPHPAHTDLSGFDSQRGLGKGEKYSFTFTIPGTWGYHNHLTPANTGVVIVD